MLTRIFITTCIAACMLTAQAEVISLKSALADKLLVVRATGTDKSYEDKALDLALENKSSKGLSIRIDTALVFRPDDTAYQDIMLAGGDVVNIPMHQTVTVQTQSYCVKSYARAPMGGLNFSYLKQGDAQMIKLMAFAAREHINSSIVQDAVWILSNGHKLGEIYDSNDPKGAEKLVHFMAELTGQPLPMVYEEHKKVTSPGEIVYVPKALKMYAKFEWKTDKVKTMTLGVYDGTGKAMETVFENKEIEKGNHRATVEFESADVPKGSYYIRLMDGGSILKEQEVKVE